MPSDVAVRIDDFLAWEEQQLDARYELIDGVVYNMTGGTLNHAALTQNLWRALADRLKGKPCRAFVEGLRVATQKGDYVFPDVLVICGPAGPKDTVARDPVLVAEILSESTEGHDRGRKFLAYQTIPALRHYLLVSAEKRLVELFSRDAAGAWSRYEAFAQASDAVRLDAIDADLPLATIYDGVTVADAAPPAEPVVLRRP